MLARLSLVLLAAGLAINGGLPAEGEEPPKIGFCAAPVSSGPSERENDERLQVRATHAVDDLLSHWWIGDDKTGHLMATHGGYPTTGRGVIWERAMVICAMEGLVSATGEPRTRDRIRAQWAYDKRQYTPAELESCGPHTPSPWSDDACWAAIYYLIAYEQTNDADALSRAKGLIRSIHARWYDNQLGGGLWYNDQRAVKSLYSAAFVYCCLWIYEATGDAGYRDMGVAEYDWIESHLLRDDHLYWCDYSAGPPADTQYESGPVGRNAPGRIHPSSSIVFLGGNMAMGACQAYLYKLTGKDAWRLDALRTAEALRLHLTDSAGRYINDRDAYTNGTFASFWARRLIALPGGGAEALGTLRLTARAIAATRTLGSYAPANGPAGAGFYSADWNGQPAWELHASEANRMHVSASSVGFIVAAAYADSSGNRRAANQ